MKRKMTCNVASAADIARRQKHIYAKNLFLQANFSTSIEQVVLGTLLHPLAIE